jgi:sulfoxide reductase heme-binding subunit YedZ
MPIRELSFQKKNRHPWLRRLGASALLGAALLAGLGLSLLVLLLSRSGAGRAIPLLLDSLFAASSQQVWWYVSRSAGMVSYLLLWLSTAWGLASASKLIDRVLPRLFTFDFHQLLALLAIGFTALHMSVLALDRYLPFSAAQILLPFTAPYRPFWVGIGGTAFYLALLVSSTFYLRRHIGMRAFRAIHVLGLLAYLGAALHGLSAGTDTPLPAVQAMYQLTLLVIVFLACYWLASLLLQRLAPAPRRRHLPGLPRTSHYRQGVFARRA